MLSKKLKSNVTFYCFIDVPKLPYSSTDIRKKVAMGLSVKEDVGEEVEEYIKSRKLYV